jgi:UDP-N-acetylglucosamine--N-acetylmuramyl-(pentapeptide) pyrophosphoryl-undecaprenol N-acetylglucosamine transferase
MRAVLAGGGTGGHVIPALAIANELRDRHGAEIVFIGTERGIETRLVPAAGYPLELVEVGAIKNVSLVTRAKTLLSIPLATRQCAKFYRRYKPDVVIGVGGYASGPAMLAAGLRHIPNMVFEPNIVPGFANRMAARMAGAACVHFQETCRYFRNCTVTGVPVRRAFFEIKQRGLSERPSILVFGGSQGARAINRAVVEALPTLRERVPELLIVHQTGLKELEEVQEGYRSAGVQGKVSAFIDDMPAAFAQADLVVCRSGASTVAEITAAGKAAIFIPFPKAADDHQTKNAEALAKSGAAVFIRQSDLTADKLVTEVFRLISQRSELARMGEAARKFAHPDAAGSVAEIALRLIGTGRQSV